MNPKLKGKITESLTSVLPITGIVGLLCITLAPVPLGTFSLFLLGAVLLVVGMGLFTLGVELSMMPIGEKAGEKIAGSRLPLLILTCLIVGTFITMAEPDLQVLAQQTPAVPTRTLILAVSLGVGLCLVLGALKVIFQLELNRLLCIGYFIIFLLAAFVPSEFLPVAFDAGGVTTGPITVPFLMAFGLGLTRAQSRRGKKADSFGMIALCSLGPVAVTMLLGLLFHVSEGSYTPISLAQVDTTQDLVLAFLRDLPNYVKEVALALLPILAFFLVFQAAFFRLPRRRCIKIFVGLLYTFLGLSLFLLGVNVGFMPMGHYLGSELAGRHPLRLVPIAMVMGYFIVKAEPAVLVLNKQVEEVTQGAISQGTMMRGLSIGMAVSLGLSMVRVLTGISLLWFLVPGYALSLGLSFAVPKIFTSIAFDSGGVASGPMTATFLLPFAMGASQALGGNVAKDAFGVVAMVAMVPLVIIQLIGLSYQRKSRRVKQAPPEVFVPEPIVDLCWEVERHAE